MGFLNAPTEDTSALHWRENGPYKYDATEFRAQLLG
jgi:hypothetical protein